MIRTPTPAEVRFRVEVREWLADALPAHLRHLTFRPDPEEMRPWYRALHDRGWIAPHWPVSEGGMGASAIEQVILFEEFARAGAPDLPTQGLNHIGPLLIRFGTPDQKRRHLPPILTGERMWCQGYSEPGAGSDLAALNTRAEVDGDSLVITGQKTWATWGHHAGWMFALVRTSPGRAKGITFVLIDLSSPGITRRPIPTLAGDDEFAEVFLDAVRVPIANVVGEIDAGWSVATALLDEERLHIGAPLLANRALVRLERLVAAMPPERRGDWASAIAEARMDVETVTAAYLDSSERLAAGCAVRNESSYLKILATETTQDILDRAISAAGQLAALAQTPVVGGERIDVNEMFLQSRRLSVYGGSNEILRALVATRVLGLTGEER